MTFDIFQTTSANSGQDDNDLEPPADGTYNVELTGAEAFTSKKGDFIVRLKWTVRDVSENGYEWTDLLMFRSAKQASISKGKIEALGVSTVVANPEELNTNLQEVVGNYYGLTVKTNGQYRNTYVNGKAPAGDIPSDPSIFEPVITHPPVTATADDDMPF